MPVKFIRSILLVTFSLLFIATAIAQKTIVRGNVFDKDRAEPISFATVKIEGTNLGATTDINGFFSIADVPVGSLKIGVYYTGYETNVTEVTTKKGEIQFINIYIAEAGSKLDEVVISGKKEQAKSEVQISKLSVTAKQIRSLPSTGGQADIAQYLTVLPGVVFTGDQGGQLYIRGGSPVQNRILLDGMTIFNPFHSIGFYSVFETELIRNVDVLTGGFNSDYGGRISAVVDVKTREGNRKRLAGMVSGSPFMAKAIIEGPIVPLKKENGPSVSFVLTGKKSLIDQTAPDLYKWLEDSSGIPFSFRDVYGKVSLMTGNGSKMNVFGFNFDDGVDFPITNFNWSSKGGGMDFTLVPANSNTIVGGVFNFSSYDSDIVEADRQPRTSGINSYYGALNFSTYSKNTEVKYGLELTGFGTQFEFINALGNTLNQDANTTEVNSYVRVKRKIGPLVIEPGFRLQYYQTLGQVFPEPRLGMKYNLTDKMRIKAAGGLYSQNLLSTVNERDIVNLFVGFLSAPDETVVQQGSNEPTKDRLQKSAHAVAGIEIDLTDNFDLNVEGYYKRFTQLISLNRFKRNPQDPNYFVETGDAKGIDVSFKWEGRRAYLWGAYSLGFVTRDDGEQVYPPVFDRRHNMNIVTTYQAGHKKEWEFGARWNFGSGFPFTLTQGFYNNIPFKDGFGTDVYGGQGSLGLIYDTKRNGGRLPYYHRMDVSVKRMFDLGKHSKMEITASCTNIYDRANIFYFDRVRYARVNQLPILPSLSMQITF